MSPRDVWRKDWMNKSIDWMNKIKLKFLALIIYLSILFTNAKLWTVISDISDGLIFRFKFRWKFQQINGWRWCWWLYVADIFRLCWWFLECFKSVTQPWTLSPTHFVSNIDATSEYWQWRILDTVYLTWDSC